MSGPGHAQDQIQTHTATWVLDRTTTGPTDITVSVGTSMESVPGHGHSHRLTGIHLVRDLPGQAPASVFSAASFESGRPAPIAVVNGEQVGCETATQEPGCGQLFTLGAGTQLVVASDDGLDDPGAATHVYVVAQGSTPPRLSLEGTGWVIREDAPRLDFAVIADEDAASGAGVHSDLLGAEAFLSSGTLLGGAHGSVAHGQLPYSRSMVTVAGVGAGSATLLGGSNQPEVTCPLHANAFDATGDSTRWSFEGLAAGRTTLSHVRLLVIDLPPIPDELPEGLLGAR